MLPHTSLSKHRQGKTSHSQFWCGVIKSCWKWENPSWLQMQPFSFLFLCHAILQHIKGTQCNTAWCTITLSPRISFSNSPYCHTTLKMLVQRIWYWINLFHLITCLLDVVMILEWKILSSSFIWVKGLILPLALVFRGRNIVGASSLNIVVMTDIDGKHFFRFSP